MKINGFSTPIHIEIYIKIISSASCMLAAVFVPVASNRNIDNSKY